MTFQTGQFQKLKAIGTFNFGPLNGITIKEGTLMEFDGTTLKLNGADHPCPQFELAVKANFVVPVSDNTTTMQTQGSSVQVKSATSRGETREAVDMGTVVEEEQVVGSVGSTKEKRDNAISTHTQQAQAAPAPAPTPAPQPKVAAAAPQVPTGKALTVEEADALNTAALQAELNKPVTKGYVGGNLVDKADEDDDGQPERTVGGGKFKLQMSDGASQGVVIGQVKSGANSAKVGRDGEAAGKGAVDVTKTTSASVENSLQEQKIVEGIKGLEAKTASVQTGIQNTGAQVVSGEGGIKHNPPKPMASTTVITEGDDIREVVGGVTGDAREMTSGEELTELLPNAAVAAPPKKAQPVEDEPEITLPGAVQASEEESQPWDEDDDEIGAILADWNKKRHWQKRVTEAVEMYGDWPEFLERLYEIEADSVVKHIKSRLVKKAAEAG